MRIVFRPPQTWPGRLRDESERRDAAWDSTYTQTRRLLVAEAHHLDALEVVVHLAVPDNRILRSGDDLKANAKPDHPGVLVVLTLPGGQSQSLHCDQYDRRYYRSSEGWHDNLRAIAKSLEALRALDRWGATQGRQYAGFRALGSGIAMGPGDTPQMTVEDAARFIADHAGAPDAWEDIVDDLAGVRIAYVRDAAKVLHPDAGGDATLFARLQEAKAILDQHGGAR